MKPLAIKTSDFIILDRLRSLTENYTYLIQYFASGNNDPQHEDILTKIIAKTFLLLDDIQTATTAESSLRLQMKSKAADYIPDDNQYSNLKKIFYDTWLGNHCTETGLLTEDERQMFLSALTLNILYHFSEENILTVCRLVQTGSDSTSLIAIVCLLIITHKYNKRLPFFPEITQQLNLIASDSEKQESVFVIAKQLLDTSLTPLINQEMESLGKDLMPEIKNRNENIIIAIDELDEGNPEWGDGIKNVFDKHIDNMTHLHSEGADINYSSTKGILTDGFFHNDIANWFMPFGWDNPELKIDFNSESGKLVKGILLANIEACDTDRYAICSIYRHIQGQLSSNRMPSIINDMTEFGNLSDLNLNDGTKSVTLNYIRCLYRFFNNNPWKIENQMEDITRIGSDYAVRLLLTDAQILSLADRCIALNLYEETASILTDDSAICLQKRGYALQKLELYDKALEAYNKALQLSSDTWTLSHAAFCMQKLLSYNDALNIYNFLLSSDKDNRNLLLQKAQCLMATDNMKDALDVFFHLDIMYPGDKNIQRGLAWCAFVTATPDNGNYHIAEQYLENLVYGENPDFNDYINYGHVLLATQHRKEAVSIYHKIAESKEDRARFQKQMAADKSILLGKGISIEDLTLTIDAVLMS